MVKLVLATLMPHGTYHDSVLAEMGGVYKKVDQMFSATCGKIIVDSAFARTKHQASLVKSYQSNVDRQGRFQQSPALNKDATSVWQLSEWGMQAFQSAFPRVRDQLQYEEVGERRLILQSLVLLYNFRGSTVGLNQIQSVYMPNLKRTANEFIPL